MIQSNIDGALCKFYEVRIICYPFAKESKVIRRTVSVLLRIARGSVDGRPTLIATNQVSKVFESIGTLEIFELTKMNIKGYQNGFLGYTSFLHNKCSDNYFARFLSNMQNALIFYLNDLFTQLMHP